MADYLFGFFFTSAKQGKGGITATVNVINVASDALVVTAQPTNVSVNCPGVHTYRAIGLPDGDYIAVASTTDGTVDSKDVPAIARKQIESYLDDNISHIDTVLTAAHGSGSWVDGGSGSQNFEYTLTDSVTLLPIDGASVDVTTDLAGTNIIASGYTDVFGNVTFRLDPGTYYLWRSKSGYTFTDPDTEVIP